MGTITELKRIQFEEKKNVNLFTIQIQKLEKKKEKGKEKPLLQTININNNNQLINTVSNKSCRPPLF